MRPPRLLPFALLASAVALSVLLYRQLHHPVTSDTGSAAKPVAETDVRRLEPSATSARTIVQTRVPTQPSTARANLITSTSADSFVISDEIDPGTRDGLSTYSGLLEAWETKLRDDSVSASLIISQLGQESDPEIISILERALKSNAASRFTGAETSDVLRIAASESGAVANRQAALSIASAVSHVEPWHVDAVATIAKSTSSESVCMESVNTLGNWQRTFPEQAELITRELFTALEETKSDAVQSQVLATLARDSVTLTDEQLKATGELLANSKSEVQIHAAELLGSASGPGAQNAIKCLQQADVRVTDPALKRVIQSQLMRLCGQPAPQP